MKDRLDGAIRWDELRERLAHVAAGGADVNAPEQDVVERVYRLRARRLAEQHRAGADVSATLAVLVFHVGNERYAIDLAELAEVFPFRGCTAVPGSPASLLGVINVRGEIRSVADLRRILNLPPSEHATNGFVVMLRHQDGTVGFKVDSVDEVRRIDPAQLVSAIDGESPIPGSRFVKALTVDTVILLDTAAALAGLGSGTS